MSQKGVYPIIKDSTKIVVMEDDAMERDILVRKDFDPSIWCKCRICSTMKTDKECRQEVEAVLDFNLQGITCPESSNNFIGINS